MNFSIRTCFAILQIWHLNDTPLRVQPHRASASAVALTLVIAHIDFTRTTHTKYRRHTHSLALLIESNLIHTSINVCVCVYVCVKMLTLRQWGCCVNTENGYRTHSLCLYLHQIVYGNTMLLFDTNVNVDARMRLQCLRWCWCWHRRSVLPRLYFSYSKSKQ